MARCGLFICTKLKSNLNKPITKSATEIIRLNSKPQTKISKHCKFTVLPYCSHKLNLWLNFPSFVGMQPTLQMLFMPMLSTHQLLQLLLLQFTDLQQQVPPRQLLGRRDPALLPLLPQQHLHNSQVLPYLYHQRLHPPPH